MTSPGSDTGTEAGPDAGPDAGPAFRCSAASRLDHEPLAGSAPTERAWLLVEHAGPWGRKAVAESRLPVEVRDFLGGIAGVRVQLVRRYGGEQGDGVRVLAAHLDPAGGARVWTTLLADVRELLDLDVAALAAGADPGLAVYDGPLWLVCTNGRRDVCCAEQGRPVAAALAERWPEATWETTHLGGHRFSGTLLALPAGVALGRLDPASAVAACAELEAGRLPVDVVRGRVAEVPEAQVAELHLRAELGLRGLDDVVVDGVAATVAGGTAVTLAADGGTHVVRVVSAAGEPRRQSCADLTAKPGRVYAVESWTPVVDCTGGGRAVGSDGLPGSR